MKLTLRWLQEFVDLPTDDPAGIAAALESLGHEVEEIRPIEAEFRGVVIGKVLEVAPHPNADRVRVCQVDVGGEVAEIVCGAWNFEAGAIVPVALPGAVLGADFEIGRRDIRGVTSNGMICSESELGIGDDHRGIMVLDGSYPEASEHLGEGLLTVLPLPDVYFDVAITPNRPDCMSVLGLARELAAYYRVPLHEPPVTVDEQLPASVITVTIDDEEACPRFVGREVRDIRVGPSPHWVRRRLVAAGVRPINNVVDASNYAMIELGHPTHAFDADRLGDSVVVRRARPGERIVTLDDQDRELLPSDIVVADANRPVAIAGVMGGADTEVHEGTTRIFIEAAYWDPPSVLLTSKRLGLRSEASARFERGMDPNFCHVAADRVAQLLEGGGATVASGLVDAYPKAIAPASLELPVSEIERVLGIAIPGEQAKEYLDRLGFAPTGDDPIVVQVPTRRPDVSRPVDLIEEVARLHGYDAIPDRIATGPGGGLPLEERRLRKLREIMAGAGYHEVMTFSFIGDDDLDRLGLPEDDHRRRGIPVVNPLRDEEGVMRTTLLPGLLKATGNNVGRHIPDVALFEVGKVFIPGAGKLPEQPDHLAFIATGSAARGWLGGQRLVDVFDATGLWELLADHLQISDPRTAQGTAPSFHPGRTALVGSGDEEIGVVGEIHPSVARAFDLVPPVIGGEIDLAAVLARRDFWRFRRPSVYPPAIFDLAFELDESVPAANLLAAVDEAAGELLEERTIFDVFDGDPLPPGRKSIAIRIRLRAPERTLTDEEVAPVRRAIVDAVIARTGGTLRGEI